MTDTARLPRRPALVAIALWLAGSAAAAQTWCSLPDLDPTEGTICATPLLAALDAQMTAFYDSSGATIRSQNEWIADRSTCGADAGCIEAAYRDRIAMLMAPTFAAPLPPPPAPVPATAPDAAREELLRPWCGAATLNLVERTICSSATLADMDAAMGAVYGAARARDDDADQTEWLRGQRDACGADETCIGRAYLNRIIALGGRIRANEG